MTWPQLQAYVDEVAAKFGEKNWQVLPVPSLKDGGLIEAFPSTVRFVEPKLATCEPKALRFDLAAKVGEAIVFRRARLRGIARAILVLLGVVAIAWSAREIPGPAWGFIGFASVYLVGLLPLFWVAKVLRTEAFLRNLLYLTEDPVRTREYLVSMKAKPKELAKFDELVRDMKLESPKPA